MRYGFSGGFKDYAPYLSKHFVFITIVVILAQSLGSEIVAYLTPIPLWLDVTMRLLFKLFQHLLSYCNVQN